MLFDLTCNNPDRGEGIVEQDLSFERAVEVAVEGGVEDAEKRLKEAFVEQWGVEIQRPGLYPEMLFPHDPPLNADQS